MTGRFAINPSSSDFSRSKASWVNQVAWVSVTVINSFREQGVSPPGAGRRRGNGVSGTGRHAPSKEKHDPLAGRVQDTLARCAPLIAAAR
ncbi:hypothetical protein PSA01_46010 [Pseudonocardia saturnea]|uniref:Uncharacterized protein n=1 Tax=Pseudonocardia saturnea TaxID=33909 RepID=A0ABQ0S3T1_9PSEU|nr:hypothetical protein PSA01_46010 [Pseudonocardia saturnea]